MRPLIAILCSGLALSLPGAVSAQDSFTAPSEIDAAVEAFTGKPVGEAGGARSAADARLRLARCSQNLEVEWYGERRDTLRVFCPVPGGWRVFVTVVAGISGETVVRRGDLVQLRIDGTGFSVSGRGEALEQGTPGQTISVRLSSSEKRQVVRGQVMDAGVVGVSLP